MTTCQAGLPGAAAAGMTPVGGCLMPVGGTMLMRPVSAVQRAPAEADAGCTHVRDVHTGELRSEKDVAEEKDVADWVDAIWESFSTNGGGAQSEKVDDDEIKAFDPESLKRIAEEAARAVKEQQEEQKKARSSKQDGGGQHIEKRAVPESNRRESQESSTEVVSKTSSNQSKGSNSQEDQGVEARLAACEIFAGTAKGVSKFKQEVFSKLAFLGMPHGDASSLKHLWKFVNLTAKLVSETEGLQSKLSHKLLRALSKELGAPRAELFVKWLSEKTQTYFARQIDLPALAEVDTVTDAGPQLSAPGAEPTTITDEGATSSKMAASDDALDEAWVELSNQDGGAYFWDRRSNSCTWELPAGVRAKWRGRKVADGRTYYWSLSGGEACWVLPKLEGCSEATSNTCSSTGLELEDETPVPSAPAAAIKPKEVANTEDSAMETPVLAPLPAEAITGARPILLPGAGLLQPLVVVPVSASAQSEEAEEPDLGPFEQALRQSTREADSAQSVKEAHIEQLNSKLEEMTADSSSLRAEVALLKKELANLMGMRSAVAQPQQQEDHQGADNDDKSTSKTSEPEAVNIVQNPVDASTSEAAATKTRVELASKAEEEPAQPAIDSEDERAQPASDSEDERAQPASDSEDERSQLASISGDECAQPASDSEDDAQICDRNRTDDSEYERNNDRVRTASDSEDEGGADDAKHAGSEEEDDCSRRESDFEEQEEDDQERSVSDSEGELDDDCNGIRHASASEEEVENDHRSCSHSSEEEAEDDCARSASDSEEEAKKHCASPADNSDDDRRSPVNGSEEEEKDDSSPSDSFFAIHRKRLQQREKERAEEKKRRQEAKRCEDEEPPLKRRRAKCPPPRANSSPQSASREEEAESPALVIKSRRLLSASPSRNAQRNRADEAPGRVAFAPAIESPAPAVESRRVLSPSPSRNAPSKRADKVERWTCESPAPAMTLGSSQASPLSRRPEATMQMCESPALAKTPGRSPASPLRRRPAAPLEKLTTTPSRPLPSPLRRRPAGQEAEATMLLMSPPISPPMSRSTESTDCSGRAQACKQKRSVFDFAGPSPVRQRPAASAENNSGWAFWAPRGSDDRDTTAKFASSTQDLGVPKPSEDGSRSAEGVCLPSLAAGEGMLEKFMFNFQDDVKLDNFITEVKNEKSCQLPKTDDSASREHARRARKVKNEKSCQLPKTDDSASREHVKRARKVKNEKSCQLSKTDDSASRKSDDSPARPPGQWHSPPSQPARSRSDKKHDRAESKRDRRAARKGREVSVVPSKRSRRAS